MKGLEESIGLQLFNRTPGGFTLTEAGATLLPLAHKVVSATLDFRTMADSLRQSARATLRVGTIQDPESIRLGPFVRGLAFVGFPLHPAGNPSTTRAEHLARVEIPMLFLQGTRDALAEWPLVERTVAALHADVTLARFDDADHSFHVPKSSGWSDADVLEAMLDAFAGWVGTLPGR